MSWKDRLAKLPPAEQERLKEENKRRARDRRARLKKTVTAGDSESPSPSESTPSPSSSYAPISRRVFVQYHGPFTKHPDVWSKLGIPWRSSILTPGEYVELRLSPTEDIRTIPTEATFIESAPGQRHVRVRAYVYRDPKTDVILRSAFLGEDEAAAALRAECDRRIHRPKAVPS